MIKMINEIVNGVKTYEGQVGEGRGRLPESRDFEQCWKMTRVHQSSKVDRKQCVPSQEEELGVLV